jgi:hypothetical protein
LAFRRQLCRPRPAADAFLSAYLSASPTCQEFHAVYESQVSAKDLKVTLELLAASAALLQYQPSSSCPAEQKQLVQEAQDAFAAAIIQRRLKSLYFHLSSGNRLRSNAALKLLAAVAGRGSSVLRALVSSFDLSHSALPKLARPPRQQAVAAAEAGSDLIAADAAAAAAVNAAAASSDASTPYWASWSSSAVGRRPSRALFVEWGECQQQQQQQQQQPPLVPCSATHV